MSDPVRLSVTLGELLSELESPPVRHAVARSGEREPISLLVRLSVYRRDGRRCRLCGYETPEMELDHIVPWSAGGGDHTANLRTLCKPCNQARSNFYDVAEDRLPPPTTWWCWHCWRDPDIEVDDPDLSEWGEPHSQFRSVWKDGTSLAMAPFVTEPETLVYCATCWTYSYSNVLFSEAMQADLVARCCPADPTKHAAAARAAMREGVA